MAGVEYFYLCEVYVGSHPGEPTFKENYDTHTIMLRIVVRRHWVRAPVPGRPVSHCPCLVCGL